MAGYEATIQSQWTRERTFDYLADFRGVAEWDPSITSSELQSGRAGEKGATYDVTLRAGGREMTIPYTAVEVVRPTRIRMRGETDSIVSLDTITVSESNGQVQVTYRAELELKGVRKLADPLAELALTRASNKARDGLQQKLST